MTRQCAYVAIIAIMPLMMGSSGCPYNVNLDVLPTVAVHNLVGFTGKGDANPPTLTQFPNLPANVLTTISFDTFFVDGPFPPYVGLIGLYDGIDNQPGLVVGMDRFFATAFAGRSFSDVFGFDESAMITAVQTFDVPAIADWANFNAAVFINPADTGAHGVVFAAGSLLKFSNGTPAGSIFIEATSLGPAVEEVPEPATVWQLAIGLALTAFMLLVRREGRMAYLPRLP